MKRFFLVAALVTMVGGTVFGGAATILTPKYDNVGAVTVDSTWDGTWESLGNLIIGTIDDSCDIWLTVDGIAIMDPGDKLWLGTSNASATARDLDSAVIKCPLWAEGEMYIPFSYTSVYQYRSATDITDTVYFNAACGGSGDTDPVSLTDVIIRFNQTQD